MSKREPYDRDWSQAAGSLFRASRADHDPTASDRARVRAALAQRLTDGAPLMTDGDAPAAAKALGSAAAGNLVKIALGVAFVAAGAFVLTRKDDSPPGAEKAELATLARPTPVTKPAAPSIESVPRETPASSSTSPSAQTTNVKRSRGMSQRSRADAVEESAEAPAPRQVRSNVTRGAQHPVAAKAAALQSASAPSEQEAPAATTARRALDSQTEPAPSESPAPVVAPVTARDDKLDDARSELDLVKRIHLAMRDGNLEGALALCAEHERRWPRGTFALEREGIRAIASCESHSNEAGRRARAFLERYPRAALAPRVAAACAPQLATSVRNRPGSGVD